MTRTVSEEKKALRRQVKERVAQLPKDYCQKSDAAIRQYVLPLVETGKLKMTIPDRPGGPRQTYYKA